MYPLTQAITRKFGVFLFLSFLVYYQKIETKGVVELRRQQDKGKATDCPYCQGKGYFQLLLGGSETCDSCSGSGAKA